MRTTLFLAACMAWLGSDVLGQGVFLFQNATELDRRALTRVGAIDGPLAGPGFLAQVFAGPTADSLTPIGRASPHLDGEYAGFVAGGVVEVPGSPPFTMVYVQMVAWDGRIWGSSLAAVPPEWLGRTDIVTVDLAYSLFGPPASRPFFTQPAIVSIPEPSLLVLLCLGGGALVCGNGWFGRFRTLFRHTVAI